MIDIHHHLLFGLDDGSKNIETSIAMVEMAAKDGITHIVCTPHANSHYHFDPVENQERRAQLQERIGEKITLGLGCDFHLSFDNIEDALKNPFKYTINQKQYLLVEFADFSIPTQISDVFYEFLVAGVQPILTHPERNAVILQHPKRLNGWIEQGCLVQVTASSLTGRFGRESQRFALRLLDENKIDFLATDAHNLDSRPPRMKEAFDLVSKRRGEPTAKRLCVDNPRAAFFSEAIPRQTAREDSATTPQAKDRSFFSRLFGRR